MIMKWTTSSYENSSIWERNSRLLGSQEWLDPMWESGVLGWYLLLYIIIYIYSRILLVDKSLLKFNTQYHPQSYYIYYSNHSQGGGIFSIIMIRKPELARVLEDDSPCQNPSFKRGRGGSCRFHSGLQSDGSPSCRRPCVTSMSSGSPAETMDASIQSPGAGQKSGTTHEPSGFPWEKNTT